MDLVFIVFISSHSFNQKEGRQYERKFLPIRPLILDRYFIGPIAPHLTLFSEFLAKQGYSYATGQR